MEYFKLLKLQLVIVQSITPILIHILNYTLQHTVPNVCEEIPAAQLECDITCCPTFQ